MDLFLFANFFPYKKSEPFLVNEIQFAKKHASTFTVFTLYGLTSQLTNDTSDMRLLQPVFDSVGSKSDILLKGLFNAAPFNIHLQEFFSKRLFLSPKKLYWFFISLLITRAVLSSKAYKELIEQIKASQKPVLYFYWGDNLAWIIPYLKKEVRSKAKIVLRLHGSDLYEHLKADYAPLREKIFTYADQIYTVSENGKNYLQKKYPAYADKISLARLGVFDNKIGPAPKSVLNIVSVSNVVPLKRVHLIFEALQLLDQHIHWHHFGEGPLLNELRETIKNKRSNIEITLHGFVSNSFLLEFYKTIPVTLFLNVSTTEGVPVSIMEVLSFGIPVVATDVGGTSELVNSNCGRLLPSNLSALQLANAMAYFFQLSEQEYTGFRSAARKQFEDKAFADKNYESFYSQL